MSLNTPLTVSSAQSKILWSQRLALKIKKLVKRQTDSGRLQERWIYPLPRQGKISRRGIPPPFITFCSPIYFLHQNDSSSVDLLYCMPTYVWHHRLHKCGSDFVSKLMTVNADWRNERFSARSALSALIMISFYWCTSLEFTSLIFNIFHWKRFAKSPVDWHWK